MYINTSKGVIVRTRTVSKRISSTKGLYFRLVPNAIIINGVMRSAIQCNNWGGYSSNEGGIILPQKYKASEFRSLEIVQEEDEYYVTIGGHRYYYSLIDFIGNRRGDYWLVINGSEMDYHLGSFLDKSIKVFDAIESVFFNELLETYPAIKQGSKPSLLFSLFGLYQELIWHEQAVRQSNLYHAQARHDLRMSTEVIQNTINSILPHLKSDSMI